MATVGGLTGGMIDPGGGGIRPPVGEGRPVSSGAPQQSRGIADGALIEGLVTGKEGELYQVRIGSQTMNARSTVTLFVGQRFRAIWDSSASPPILRLQQGDMAVLARFTGRDQGVALTLLSRGMPVDDETVLELRREWIKFGGDPAKLGVLAELWARGAEMTEKNVSLLLWYMDLLPEHVAQIWKKIRERLRNGKFASPRELIASLHSDEDEDVSRFLGAHALAGRPAKGGLDPASLLAPAWWPVGENSGEPVTARVAFSNEKLNDRRVWRSAFGFEGKSLGLVEGDVISNGKALSVNIRLDSETRASRVRNALPILREELDEIPLSLQYIGVGVANRGVSESETRYGLDMEV